MTLRSKSFAEFLTKAHQWVVGGHVSQHGRGATAKRRRRIRIVLRSKRSIRARTPAALHRRPHVKQKRVAETPGRLVAATQPVSPPGRGKPSFFLRARSDGIPDILDAIQELGGIRSPTGYRFSDKGEYDGFKEAFRGEARLLIRGRTGLRPDDLRAHLTNQESGIGQTFRLESISDLYDAVAAAVRERGAVKTRATKESRAQGILARFISGKRSGCASGVKTGDLRSGDRFNIMRQPCTVRQVDPDTFAVEIDCEDGGRHELPDGITVYPDRCVIDRAGRETTVEWPNPKRKAYGGGQPAQRDMFGGGGEGAFTLVGQKGTDFERRQRETDQQERERKESERGQLGLINPMKKKRKKSITIMLDPDPAAWGSDADEEFADLANPELSRRLEADGYKVMMNSGAATRILADTEDEKEDAKRAIERYFVAASNAAIRKQKAMRGNPLKKRAKRRTKKSKAASGKRSMTASQRVCRCTTKSMKANPRRRRSNRKTKAIPRTIKLTHRRKHAKRNPSANIFLVRDNKGNLVCTQGVIIANGNLKLFAHQPPGAKTWSVSEYRSGATLVKGLNGIAAAKSAVVATVNRRGLSGIRRAAVAIVKRYGVANE